MLSSSTCNLLYQERLKSLQKPRTLLRPTEKRYNDLYNRRLSSDKNELYVIILSLIYLKVDSLIEAFGTNKQKRALSSRRLNQVGSDTLHQAVAKAANAVIDQKGLEGKLHGLMNIEVCSMTKS